MKVAIVHDWLNQMGGAENVLETLVDMFPGSPVYTSIYDPDSMPPEYRSWDIRTSFMQHFPGVTSHHQMYLPFYPLAFETFRLDDFDVIISNKSGFCHGVKKGSNAVHISYCLTPTRFLWMYDSYRERESIGKAADLALRPLLALLRRWDLMAARKRVDHFIAISTEIQARIKRIYGRESKVIFPPVDTQSFQVSESPPEDFFLVASRLIPYKRIDLAIEAANRLGLKLVVVGDGRDRKKLEAMAGPTVRFLGRVSKVELRSLLSRCSAFVFPGLEDFGIAPVEAMASGRPVIAYKGGGALDTVVPGVTGEFFYPQTAEALAEVLSKFDPLAYNPMECRKQAEKFDASIFRREFMEFLEQVVGG